MKQTVETIRKKYQEIQNEAKQKQAKIKEKQARIAELEKKNEQAAKAGDYVQYKSTLEEIQKEQLTVFVLLESIKAAGQISADEAREAWETYAAAHDKEFAKLWKEYEKARHDLCKQFENILRYQNEAWTIREEIAEMTGIERTEARDHYRLKEIIPTEKHEHYSPIISTPDPKFYMDIGEWKASGYLKWPGSETAYAVIVMEQACRCEF